MDSDLKKFIDRYIERGFGSMNKNDFEVEIFHYLLQTNYFESTKDYEISRQLRIPQSKVKRLKYESELKYPEKNQDEKVREILDNAHIFFDKESIVLSIENEIVRKYLDCKIKKHNGYTDMSFNSELLRLSFDDYIFLVEEFEGKDNVDKIKGKLDLWYKNKCDNEKTKQEKICFKDLFFGFVKSFADGAIQVTANLIINKLLEIN